jgi:hypothetical protein
MIKWISNFISDIQSAWVFWRYKRANPYHHHWDYMQEAQIDDRFLARHEMWSSVNSVMESYNNAHPFDNPDNPVDDGDGYEYSGGPVGSEIGHKIYRSVSGYGKRIGMYFHYDNFYFGMKNAGDSEYGNWLYINTSGLSKHNWRVEIVGVDEV